MPSPALPSRPKTIALGVLILVVVAAYVVLPLLLPVFWVQLVVFAAAAAVAAIGLQFLIGTSGQLSLAHSFFMAVGAYAYAVLGKGNGIDSAGWQIGMPSVLAAIAAVVAAGLVGFLFSFISARLRGLYLGLASLGLVMIGAHVLTVAHHLTGGVYGRDVAVLTVGGFGFSDTNPPLWFGTHQLLGIGRLWYLTLAVLLIGYWLLRNVARGRAGRAMNALRDSESAAAAAGVRVQHYKALAYVISSCYAGLGGVLTALAFQHIVPTYFSLTLSLNFLAMVVIGGMRSITGAVVGAFVVTGLPLVLSNYAGSLPFLGAPGSGGLEPGVFAQFVFGAVVIVVLILQWADLRGRRRGFRVLLPARTARPDAPLASTNR